MTTMLLALLLAAGQARAGAPTRADEKYDTKHERNVLDFWQAKSDKPAPVVIWFHGGGFTQGDKRQIVDRDNVVGGFLAKGVSVASCNIPLRMTVLALLCAGSAWGLHVLGLRWLWAAPLGIVAGIVLWAVFLALDVRNRSGCCVPPPFPPNQDTPYPPIPRPRDPNSPSGA